MQENKSILGIIGGLGPLATALFAEEVIKMTDADTDQQHLDMIIYSFPSIPDRTGFILGRTNEDPVPEIVRIGRQLSSLGAKFIAIPCITAHCFHDRIEKDIPAAVINAVTETALHLKENGVTHAGIMATDGTVSLKLFNNELLKFGITPVTPSPERQKDVMSVIYDDIKANRRPDMCKFSRAVKELRENGAQAIILGCTELSLIKRDGSIGSGFIDVLDVLAKRSIELCGGKLKEEYGRLIT